jgi:hypothetical protein
MTKRERSRRQSRKLSSNMLHMKPDSDTFGLIQNIGQVEFGLVHLANQELVPRRRSHVL